MSVHQCFCNRKPEPVTAFAPFRMRRIHSTKSGDRKLAILFCDTSTAIGDVNFKDVAGQ